MDSVVGPLANSTISFNYAALGRMTNRTINSVAEGVAFDDLGRVTNHFTSLGAFVYDYVNATRRLHSVSAPSPSPLVTTFMAEYVPPPEPFRYTFIDGAPQAIPTYPVRENSHPPSVTR